MVGAYGGGVMARFIPGTVLLIGFAVMMVATAVAMLRGRQGAWLFVRRISGRDEQDLIQTQQTPRRLRNREMAAVNRIKTAAQNSQTHRRLPSRTIVQVSDGQAPVERRPASAASGGRYKSTRLSR